MMSPSGSPPFSAKVATEYPDFYDDDNEDVYNGQHLDDDTTDDGDYYYNEPSVCSSSQPQKIPPDQLSPLVSSSQVMQSKQQGNRRTRKRNLNQNDGLAQHQQQHHHHAQQENYYPDQRLQSMTLGGYGPISEESLSDKDHGRTFPNRVSSCFTYIAQIGAKNSSHEDSLTHYQDNFNDQSWSCSLGTAEENGIWTNTNDQAGTIMALLVWLLLGYSDLTILTLAESGAIPFYFAFIYSVFCSLALASHVKTMMTDPGSVPQSAVPQMRDVRQSHAMCSQCQTFKPPGSHHCRICNRCISRMDHHCPWMNRAGNLKHFILFLIYIWISSALAIYLIGWSYFFCAIEDECPHTPLVLTQLIRIMMVLCIGAFLFSSSMIMNVSYGLMTGIGTIDRLKKKATNTMALSAEEPISLTDVFGIAGYWSWWIPLDPMFEDCEVIMGYSTPQRLLREQMREKAEDMDVEDWKV